jgi:hypothetical protein
MRECQGHGPCSNAPHLAKTAHRATTVACTGAVALDVAVENYVTTDHPLPFPPVSSLGARRCGRPVSLPRSTIESTQDT